MSEPNLHLDKLETLEKAATPGPWYNAHGELVHDWDNDGYIKLALSPCPNSPLKSTRRKHWDADRAFIAALRNAAPALFAAARERDALRERVGKAERERDEERAYVAAEIDRAPEPLRRLGEYLANLLDDDRWKTAERFVLGAVEAYNSAYTRATEAEADLLRYKRVCCGNGDGMKPGTPDANECCGQFRDSIELLRETQDALTVAGARADKNEEAHNVTLSERDNAEEWYSQTYFALTGHSPEWSNEFGYEQAHDELIECKTLMAEVIRRQDGALTAAQARIKVLEDVIAKAQAAVNAAYYQAVAEHAGNDRRASKFQDIVDDFRRAARALGDTK